MLICPICKHEHTAPVVPVVDTEQDKETWKAVQDGSLFRFDCPDCGCPMEMAYSFLCRDSDIRQYIHLCREEPDESGALQSMGKALVSAALSLVREVVFGDGMATFLSLSQGKGDTSTAAPTAVPCI